MDIPEQEYVQICEELETKRQELHAARRQIEILIANVTHLENDNAELNNALSEATQKCKDTQSHDQEMSDHKHRRQLADLQQMLDEAQASEKMAKEAEKKLEQQLKHAVETAALVVPHTVDNDDDTSALLLQVSELETEKSSLKLKLYESAMELKQQTDEVARLYKELTEKDEEIECIENQFTTQCSINERLREENSEIRAQLEAESGHVDTGRKGNSLFAEVDDRRVFAEKKILKLESTLRELEEKLTKEQKENKRLKLQILLLRQTSSKGYDDNVVKNLQGQLMESKRTIIHLTEQLQKRDPPSKHKPVQEIKFSDREGATDNDKLFINFLQGIITQKKKETEEAKALAQQNHLQSLRTELHLTEVKNEVVTLTSDCDRLKVMNSHLTMTVQELQRKYEPELFAPPSKEKIKIPLSETDSSSVPQKKTPKPNVGPNCAQNSTGRHHRQSQCEVYPDDPAVPPEECDTNSKENIPLQQSNDFPDTRCGKSVRMMQQVNVIGSKEEQSVAELKADGQGEKVRKNGRGTGKYRNVTHVDVDTQPAECKQQ